MTTTEIQNLSGVELAREVAEKVMGFADRDIAEIDDDLMIFRHPVNVSCSFRPDRDGSDMLEVIGQMQALHFCVSISDTDSGFVCRFWKTPTDEYAGEGKDLPVAVCRAALTAILADAKGGE